MKFCLNCGNMYYIKIQSQEENTPNENGNSNDSDQEENHINDTLEYYCRCCGYVETNISKENVIVSISNITQKNIKPKFVVNEYTKYDPTIPRVQHIPCVSKECPSIVEPDKHPANVLYIRYDTDNLKYMFMCEHCNTTWVNDNKLQ